MVIILSIVFSGTGIEDFIIDEDGVLQETYCTDQTLIVPDGVVKIASGAGRNMAMAVKLVIPEGVTEIGEKAFYGAHGLQAIYLPSTLERLDGDKLMAGSVSKKITVYFGGSRDRAEALGLADKITTVGDLSTFEEKFFNNGITQNCESIEFVYDVDYMEEFYKD